MIKTHIYTLIYTLLHVLLIVFLLWLTVQPLEIRWTETDVWLCFALPIIGGVGVLGILCSKEPCRFTITDGLVAVWTLYYIGRVWVGAEYPCAKEWLQTMEMVMLYVVLRIMLHDTKVQAWALCAGIVVFGCYEAIIGVSQLFTGQGRHHLFALTGTFQNPGPYSAYLMMAATIDICCLPSARHVLPSCLKSLLDVIRKSFCAKCHDSRNSCDSRIGNYLMLIVLYLPLLVLPATWSRAALVGFGVCALWIFRKRYWRYRWLVWGALVVLAAGFYFLKQGSADGRTLIWMAMLTSWWHEPWLGVGVGGFCHACAEGIAEMWKANPDSCMFDSAGVADYAYNSLIKILAEQGVVGALLCVCLTVVAMWRLSKVSMPLFMAMLSLLIFSMFSYPFELLPYKIIVALVFAWSESVNKASLCLRIGRVGCAFACLITIAFCWCLKGEVVYRAEQDKGVSVFSRMQNAAFLEDYYELLPYETDNPQYLFDFAKTLRGERRYRDSNAVLRQGTLVSADPMFYIIMGNNYRDEGYADLAAQSYEHAFAVMPNRLYPLYQQMMMYDERGDKGKAYEAALRLLQIKPKIESAATREMQKATSKIVDTP